MTGKKRYVAVVVLLVVTLLQPAFASASALTQASVRLGRLGISASTSNDALTTFKLNTTPTSVAKIILTFPTGFNLTGTTTTPTTGNYPNTPAGITAPPGTLTGAISSGGTNAGGTITISGLTSASLTSTTLYGVDIPTGVITNPATAGQYVITVASANSSSTVIDTTNVATYIYGSAANQDQVSVSASVAATFSFSLSANTDTVPKIDPTAIQTSAGVSMVVATNSALGYTAYVKSANGALISATNPGTPISTGTFDGTPDALSPGTTKYGFVPTTGTACTSCTGTLTYDGEYNVTDGTHAGSFNGTSFASFEERNGYTNGDTVILKERAAVSSTVVPASDYSDTLTIVVAGNF
jgi:hypothetical protein